MGPRYYKDQARDRPTQSRVPGRFSIAVGKQLVLDRPERDGNRQQRPGEGIDQQQLGVVIPEGPKRPQRPPGRDCVAHEMQRGGDGSQTEQAAKRRKQDGETAVSRPQERQEPTFRPPPGNIYGQQDAYKQAENRMGRHAMVSRIERKVPVNHLADCSQATVQIHDGSA